MHYWWAVGSIVEVTAAGAFNIMMDDGSDVDISEFVSYPTYFKS
jgi:hypothetical protein